MVLNSVVSSAYNIYLKSSLAFGMSFIYIKKRSGPSIDPCGTPVERGNRPDFTPSTSTYCFLHVTTVYVPSGTFSLDFNDQCS